jgi:1-aminocyclopropane-1-carboxylate deaminase
MFNNPAPAPLQLISDEEIDPWGVKLYIKREDLLHSEISGNKWRKLKYNFLEAKKLGFNKILTVGGAYSNHIAAVAAASSEYGFESIGIIRGEEYSSLNPTLSFAKSKGMQLIYWNREKFRRGFDDEILNELQKSEGDFYFVPEGGTNELAVKGASEIINDIEIPFDFICSAVGTGGTLAGLINGRKEFDFSVLGFAVLKNTGFLEKGIKKLAGESSNTWEMFNSYSFGGYAKFDQSLIYFINRFFAKHQIELEPIYTGKMMFGIYDLIRKGYFSKNKVIIALHTGGLQGKEGFNQRFGKILL